MIRSSLPAWRRPWAALGGRGRLYCTETWQRTAAIRRNGRRQATDGGGERFGGFGGASGMTGDDGGDDFGCFPPNHRLHHHHPLWRKGRRRLAGRRLKRTTFCPLKEE